LNNDENNLKQPYSERSEEQGSAQRAGSYKNVVK